MLNFIIKRMAQNVVLLGLVSIVGFGVLYLAPGGPLAQFALVPGMSQAELANIAEKMGLNKPIPLQYWDWVSRLLTGDWGNSYRDGQPVLSIILSRLPATFLLMGASTFISVILGVWIGVLGAIRRYSWFDYLATLGAMVALSIPTFWFGLVVIYLFSVKLQILPAGNMYTVGDGSLLNYAHHLIAPSLVLGLVTVAQWSRYVRTAMIDVINQDYIRTARAKGAPERVVLFRHAMRNALLPIITVAGLQLPTLLSGALITETVFTWPGMGRLFLDSLGYRDYPVVMGVLMVSSLLVLLGSLLADLFYAIADPRIRLG
jgi:peptide/nickel transport system permease protein